MAFAEPQLKKNAHSGSLHNGLQHVVIFNDRFYGIGGFCLERVYRFRNVKCLLKVCHFMSILLLYYCRLLAVLYMYIVWKWSANVKSRLPYFVQ